jgi:hypothetical protein
VSKVIAFIFLAGLLVFIAVVMAKEHSAPLAMQRVNASAPQAEPYRLFSPCPLAPRNVPLLKPEVST